MGLNRVNKLGLGLQKVTVPLKEAESLRVGESGVFLLQLVVHFIQDLDEEGIEDGDDLVVPVTAGALPR